MEDIGDFMSSPVLSVDHESTIQEAAQYMEANHVGSVLIKEYQEFTGILTETDLTRRVLGKGLNPETTTVAEVMSKPLKSMDRYMTIDEANEFMHKNKIRHLAVTDEEKVVGMLSIKDLVNYYAKTAFRTQE